MSLLEFLSEIRRRSDGYPLPRSPAEAVTTLVGLAVMPGPQGESVRVVLHSLLQPEGSFGLGFRHLANLGPLALGALDQLTEGLLSGYYTEQDLRRALGQLH